MLLMIGDDETTLFHMIGLSFAARNAGRVLIVDEADKGLHYHKRFHPNQCRR